MTDPVARHRPAGLAANKILLYDYINLVIITSLSDHQDRVARAFVERSINMFDAMFHFGVRFWCVLYDEEVFAQICRRPLSELWWTIPLLESSGIDPGED